LSQSGRKVIDGLGAHRIAARLVALAKAGRKKAA